MIGVVYVNKDLERTFYGFAFLLSQGMTSNGVTVWIFFVLTQYAGFAEVGDGLSVVAACQHRGGARAGDALTVGGRGSLFNRIEERRSDLLVPIGVGSVKPAMQWRSNFGNAVHRLAAH